MNPDGESGSGSIVSCDRGTKKRLLDQGGLSTPIPSTLLAWILSKYPLTTRPQECQGLERWGGEQERWGARGRMILRDLLSPKPLFERGRNHPHLQDHSLPEKRPLLQRAIFVLSRDPEWLSHIHGWLSLIAVLPKRNSQYSSHLYHDVFTRVCPSLGRKL